MRDDQTVTIADVARQAGVSPMTVSKVMRDTGRVGEDTRARVKRAAEELGYVPNGLAGALAARSTPIVGVLIPSVSDGVYAEVLAGINTVLRPQGMQTFIGETFFNPELEAGLLRTMLPFRPAGLILAGGIARTAQAEHLLSLRRIPAVQIWDGDAPGLDATIGPSHDAAGRMAARHLLATGARACAYVGAQLDADICARRRLTGFRAELAQAGVPLTEVTDPDLPRQTDSGHDLTARLLAGGAAVDAIHYLNDAMALGGLRALFAAGIDVPGQVAVMGFNGTSCATAVRTRLTTLDLPRAEIGRQAAQAILALRDGVPLPPARPVVPRLVAGNTTR